MPRVYIYSVTCSECRHLWMYRKKGCVGRIKTTTKDRLPCPSFSGLAMCATDSCFFLVTHCLVVFYVS